MLQSVRENMKGTIFIVVIIIFIVPMVLSGVGTSFLGSVAGTNAASVNGREITNAELRRAIYGQKQRLLSQEGIDSSADFLKDENLRAPVLQNLTRRAALLDAAEKGGMGASSLVVNRQITQQQDFYVDGKFNAKRYRQLLANIGFTPATYKTEVSKDLVLKQHAQSLRATSFVTQQDIDALTAILQQKRSFYTIKIPASAVEKDVVVSDADAQQYYKDNQQAFIDPEKMSVEYIELLVDQLMENFEASDDEVREQYDLEVSQFDALPQYEVAHILIEDKDDGSHETALAAINAKLGAGEKFDVLAKAYSDDAGSRELGGELGLLGADVYPKAFEQAVYALEQGQVSPPIRTDAGVHLIKALKKSVPQVPSFAARKAAIAETIARAKAEDQYVSMIERLGELTFSSNDLSAAASELGLVVKQSAQFERGKGAGIMTEPRLRNAAFETEVLEQEHNSKVIELSNSHAIVLRKLSHKPESVKPFDAVKTQVVASVKKKQVKDKLEGISSGLISEIRAGGSAQELAERDGYTYGVHEGTKRTDSGVDFAVLRGVFSMPVVEDGINFSSQASANGDYNVVALTKVEPGVLSDMPEQQRNAVISQLGNENAKIEVGAYEQLIVNAADISIR